MDTQFGLGFNEREKLRIESERDLVKKRILENLGVTSERLLNILPSELKRLKLQIFFNLDEIIKWLLENKGKKYVINISELSFRECGLSDKKIANNKLKKLKKLWDGKIKVDYIFTKDGLNISLEIS